MALLDVGPGHPVSQAALADAEVGGELSDGLVALPGELDGTPAELRRVRTGHADSFPRWLPPQCGCPKNRGMLILGLEALGRHDGVVAVLGVSHLGQGPSGAGLSRGGKGREGAGHLVHSAALGGCAHLNWPHLRRSCSPEFLAQGRRPRARPSGHAHDPPGRPTAGWPQLASPPLRHLYQFISLASFISATRLRKLALAASSFSGGSSRSLRTPATIPARISP